MAAYWLSQREQVARLDRAAAGKRSRLGQYALQLAQIAWPLPLLQRAYRSFGQKPRLLPALCCHPSQNPLGKRWDVLGSLA
jgi:hypothetical protein